MFVGKSSVLLVKVKKILMEEQLRCSTVDVYKEKCKAKQGNTVGRVG